MRNFRNRIIGTLVFASLLSNLTFLNESAKAAPSGLAIAVTQGSKLVNSLSNDSSTGATVEVSTTLSAVSDSVYVTISPKSYPSGYTTSQIIGVLYFQDTSVSAVTTNGNDTVMIGLASAAGPGATTPLSGHVGPVQGTRGSATYNTHSSNQLVGLFSPQGSRTNAWGVGDSITTTSAGATSSLAFVIASSEIGRAHV